MKYTMNTCKLLFNSHLERISVSPMSIYTDVVKLRTPPKYAALRLAWEAYYFSCLCFQNCFAKVKPFFEKCNLFQIYFHNGCVSQLLGNPI